MASKVHPAELDLNDLGVFGAVASRRSFAAAAEALRIPKATVSRKVKSLEERLGLRLLERTTRRVSLTEVGAALLERWARIEEEAAEARAVVESYGAGPRGTLRVTAPYTVGREILSPILPEFLARYPELQVVLLLQNAPTDLIDRGVDVAVWPWPLGDTGLATRLLIRRVPSFYASPGYLKRRGRPERPEELSGHDALLYVGGAGTPRHEWTLHRGSREVTVPIRPVLACNDLAPLRDAAAGGAGILLADALTVLERVRRGELVPVLPGWAGRPIELRAVFPSRRGLAPKVRAFVDFLAERLGEAAGRS
jgi:DNA-binding transcriptional LysR family regulator